MPRKTDCACVTTLTRSCFNEAAARCRGKPPPASDSDAESARFNEAAARCRGKRKIGERLGRRARRRASMRPRPDAAENTAQERGLDPKGVVLQ